MVHYISVKDYVFSLLLIVELQKVIEIFHAGPVIISVKAIVAGAEFA
jgi:hypothetical protein